MYSNLIGGSWNKVLVQTTGINNKILVSPCSRCSYSRATVATLAGFTELELLNTATHSPGIQFALAMPLGKQVLDHCDNYQQRHYCCLNSGTAASLPAAGAAAVAPRTEGVAAGAAAEPKARGLTAGVVRLLVAASCGVRPSQPHPTRRRASPKASRGRA